MVFLSMNDICATFRFLKAGLIFDDSKWTFKEEKCLQLATFWSEWRYLHAGQIPNEEPDWAIAWSRKLSWRKKCQETFTLYWETDISGLIVWHSSISRVVESSNRSFPSLSIKASNAYFMAPYPTLNEDGSSLQHKSINTMWGKTWLGLH